MRGIEQLFKALTEEREKTSTRLKQLRESLQSLVTAAQVEDVMAAIASRCRGRSYYPGHVELGIPVELLTDLSEPVAQKVDLALQDSMANKGHIALLLKRFRKTPEEIATLRADMSHLGDTIVESVMRIKEIDTLLLVMVNIEPDLDDVAEIAKRFCEATAPG